MSFDQRTFSQLEAQISRLAIHIKAQAIEEIITSWCRELWKDQCPKHSYDMAQCLIAKGYTITERIPADHSAPIELWLHNSKGERVMSARVPDHWRRVVSEAGSSHAHHACEEGASGPCAPCDQRRHAHAP